VPRTHQAAVLVDRTAAEISPQVPATTTDREQRPGGVTDRVMADANDPTGRKF
jgi:hypothetical protein